MVLDGDSKRDMFLLLWADGLSACSWRLSASVAKEGFETPIPRAASWQRISFFGRS